MGGTRFMVQWEEHPSHLATRLGHLLEHQTLVDVTLMCNTHTLRVHRAVLAACSPYFETILQRQLGMHPLIVLKDMQFSVLKSLIEFMYCGETSVTEDNLGPLLQAAKFFQVKGLSAMTKEALGLSSTGNKGDTGDAARKAFVGRSKRVPIQQNFVTKSLPSSSASSSQLTVDAKQIIQPSGNKSVVMQQPDNQQQTDTAQLLLSLSGSEFTKQTQSLQTVSKTIRFQNSVGASGIKSEPVRTESTIKPRTIKTEAVEQPTAVVPVSNRTLSAPSHQVTETASVKDNSGAQAQNTFLAETIPARKRGRPVKRQMNIVFQEKVLTDADMALHKEAEASRKALEVLRQEMAVDPLEKASGVVPQQADPVRKIASHSGTATTMKMQMPVNPVSITSRAPSRIQTTSVKKPVSHTTYITKSIQKPAVDPPRKVLVQEEQPNDVPKRVVHSPEQPPLQIVAPNTVSSASEQVSSDSSNANTNVIYQVANTVVSNQEMFQIVDNTNSQDKSQNIVYQVADGVTGSEAESDNTGSNIIYQMADSGNSTSVMGQYMEVLKEAGIPTDVPILLDSGDGSYVTVNEEMLMNIVNGGVFQCHVAEGNIVTGDRLEFIVQEVDGEGQQTAEQPLQNTAGQIATEATETSSLGDVSQVSETTHASVGRDMPTIEEDQTENTLIDNLSADSNRGGIETFDNKPVVQEDTVAADNQEVIEQKTATEDSVVLTENSVQSSSNSTTDEAGGTENFSFETEVVDGTQTSGSTENETIFKNEQSVIVTENMSFETGEVLHTENPAHESLDFNVQQESTEIKSETVSEQNYEAGQLMEPSLKNVAVLSEENNVKTENDETTDHNVVTTTESGCVQDNEVTFTYTDTAGLPSLDDYNESQESAVPAIVTFEENEVVNGNENSNQNVIAPHSDACDNDTLASSVQVENIVYREVTDEVITGDPYGEDPSDGCLVQTDTIVKTDEKPEEFQGDNDSKDHEIFQNHTDKTTEQVTVQDQLNSSESNGMSVEQALEAMMGDGNCDTQQETADNSEAALRTSETVDASCDTHVNTEKSNREELCLMLSRDEDAPKLDDQTCSSETRKVTGSFTLVVNPDQQKDDTDNTSDTFVSAPSTEITETEELNCTLSESENVSQEECVLTVDDTAVDTSQCVDQEVSVIVQNNNEDDVQDCETVIQSTVESACDEGKEVIVQDVHTEEAVVTSEVQKICVSDISELPENYILLTDTKTEGQVISPNKDIPYAVGLLPLKTALEKFQSMPDHQPRKTRSSSTSKEGPTDAPAARVKRKASSTEGGPDRKIRVVSSSAEETFEEVISSSGLQVQDNPSNWPSVDLNVEEHREGLHAMPEMVTEPTEV